MTGTLLGHACDLIADTVICKKVTKTHVRSWRRDSGMIFTGSTLKTICIDRVLDVGSWVLTWYSITGVNSLLSLKQFRITGDIRSCWRTIRMSVVTQCSYESSAYAADFFLSSRGLQNSLHWKPSSRRDTLLLVEYIADVEEHCRLFWPTLHSLDGWYV